MDSSDTGCSALPLPMLPAVRNWALPSRFGSVCRVFVVKRFSFKLTESPMKMASSKKESAARGDSGSAPETEAETAVLSGAEEAPLPAEDVSPPEAAASDEEAAEDTSCAEDSGSDTSAAEPAAEEADSDGAEEEGRSAQPALTSITASRIARIFLFMTQIHPFGRGKSEPRRAACGVCLGFLAGFRQEKCGTGKKQAQHRRPGGFPVYFTIFSEGPQDKLQIRYHWKTSCISMPRLRKSVQKNRERKAGAAPLSVPRLRSQDAIAANYFLLKMDMMSTKSLSSTMGLLSSDGEEDSRGAE